MRVHTRDRPQKRWWSTLRILDLGTSDRTSSEARSIRVVNAVATISIVALLLYNLFYAVYDVLTLRPVIVVISVCILSFVAVLMLNAQGRYLWAAWHLFVTGWAVLVIVTALLGVDSGIWLYLVLVPLGCMLIAKPGDAFMPVVVLVVGLSMYAAVPLFFPERTELGPRFNGVVFTSAAVGAGAIASLVVFHYRRMADRAESALREANERSEHLLLNILPEPIAERLKAGESPIADRVDSVTVLFADLVDSTPLAELLSADELVDLLDRLFSHFDDLTQQYGLEKITTIGDGYLAVAGAPRPHPDHVAAAASMALAMRHDLNRFTVDGYGTLRMRWGIHTGSAVAGVIGKDKFRYDMWGDTVNTASRMESQGQAGEIHVTAAVRGVLRDRFEFEPRGVIAVRGKGDMNTYFLHGQTSAHATAPPEAR